MNGRDFDWSVIADDPIARRFGVRVRFNPRGWSPAGTVTKRAQEMYLGTTALVIPLQMGGDPRYPGEAWLANVEAGKSLFGEAWIAAGDVFVLVDETRDWLRGGIHE